ncbi:palmitoyltransferase ZDHHC1 [Rhineura floridana]|uniref:palmitoyltransferase ZDHHC1 n=1 Tax=Rhineura floridana TaxID=261503 RepID=UPI002AC7F111|nr:palmitoyltransferase ZDHHC1 [Rhineura floridana]XP_061449790.1 palmitoyltransferase ZDHHC1 [Rhineura floridana]XP_061449791.1 palmitoyltransferase ZDHHC1 [Rhineura floridana]XP_061449792.1 palmitoyltransferase ZDHHC1 [Rhineura floridana]XP_061449793.1 palmitoyltransferase ZDHHC1 [Rhineura floridana]XP_061449794.1 palmitoyltransferase ZDHHC1 [Rhineura floridana]XP_061449795.1 palmitoyltransferase ZDHHC1 [Rhineura floridana]
MNICNKPPNKTAPEKSDEAAFEAQSQHARRNGWSWPPHPFQFVAWLLFLFFALVGFGILVPLLPTHWVPAGYICPGVFFLCHLVVHLAAISIDPADEGVREKNYQGPLSTFNRSQHAHVIENRHCHICDVDVSSRSKHCGTCNKCVCGFDHHCMWLNNCVGERNYWLFLNSVISAILGLLLTLLIAFYVFVEFFLNPMTLRTNQHFEGLKNQTDVWFVFLPAAPIETHAPAILALTGVLILLGLLTLFLLGHLLVFHIYLMWHRMTTYEYIVQQRPPQEMKDPDKQLESCPPQVRPIQEMQFYGGSLGYTNPDIQVEDSSGLASGKDVIKFCIRSDGSDSKLILTPELPGVQAGDQPQKKKRKKRRKKLRKVPSSVLEERSKMPDDPWSSLPAFQPELSITAATSLTSSSSSLRLPIPAATPKVVTPTGSNGPVQAAGPPADYHSESAESMEEIPVAQTRLGSSAPSGASQSSTRHLPFPTAHSRGEGEKHQAAGHNPKGKNCQSATGQQVEELELSPKIPAVFVSKSSGEPPVTKPWSDETSSEPPHRKCSSKRPVDDQDCRIWNSSTSSTAA